MSATKEDVTMDSSAATEENPATEKYYPNFALAQVRSQYERFRRPEDLKSMLATVQEDSMLFFYKETIVEKYGIPVDASVLKPMEAAYEAQLKELDEKIKDAAENLGDIEVKNAFLAKADYLNKCGSKALALETYEKAFGKTVGVGGKMDNLLTRLRIGLFFDDKALCKKFIEESHAELKKGGDWERKNKLKVYEAMYRSAYLQDYKTAASLLLDSVATFTAYELMPFADFVLYTVLFNLIGFTTRQDLKKKVINSSEILSVIHEKASLKELLFSFHECKYFEWTRNLVQVIDLHIAQDRYLYAQTMRISKILRLNAFKQFVASYKSVTIKAMADTFGVSEAMIDQEIYDFISAGRLPCKIDKVAGVIETQDEAVTKTNQYTEIVREADILLNKMQKFAAAIDR